MEFLALRLLFLPYQLLLDGNMIQEHIHLLSSKMEPK